eukprot:3912822-Rhodomonas_salina.2
MCYVPFGPDDVGDAFLGRTGEGSRRLLRAQPTFPCRAPASDALCCAVGGQARGISAAEARAVRSRAKQLRERTASGGQGGEEGGSAVRSSPTGQPVGRELRSRAGPGPGTSVSSDILMLADGEQERELRGIVRGGGGGGGGMATQAERKGREGEEERQRLRRTWQHPLDRTWLGSGPGSEGPGRPADLFLKRPASQAPSPQAPQTVGRYGFCCAKSSEPVAASAVQAVHCGVSRSVALGFIMMRIEARRVDSGG